MSAIEARPTWTAAMLLDAVIRSYSNAAIVPEVCIMDPLAEMRTGDLWPPLTRRIDALMFQGLQRTAIEIKVSVTDVNRETYAKVAPWMTVCHRFVYVVPAGLIDRAPVNAYGAGLWWVHDNGTVEIVTKAKVRQHPEPLPQHVIQTLGYRAAKHPRAAGGASVEEPGGAS